MSPKRFLIIRDDRIGDLLMNLPLIRRLRQSFKGSHISLLCDSRFETLLSRQPDLDNVIPLEQDLDTFAGQKRLYKLLCSGHYDAVVVSNPKKPTHLLAALAGIPLRIGFNRKWGFFLNRRIQDRKVEKTRHEIDYNLELLDRICDEPWDGSLSLGAGDKGERGRLWERLGLQGTRRAVAFHAGSSNPAKQWSPERFGRVMTQLMRRGERDVLLVGEGDPNAAVSGLGLGETPHFYNLINRTSLVDLACLLRHVDLLVSLDSGPYHMAWMQGTPVVGIFVKEDPGSDPRRWGVYPGSSRNVQIYKRRDEIMPEEVLRAIDALSGAPSSQPA